MQTNKQTTRPSSCEVLLCHLARLQSAGIWGRWVSMCQVQNMSLMIKNVWKRGLVIKPGFPISWSWMGEPWSSCLTKPECEAQIVSLFIIKMCRVHIKPTSHTLVSYKQHRKETDVLLANWISALRGYPETVGGTTSSSFFSCVSHTFFFTWILPCHKNVCRLL